MRTSFFVVAVAALSLGTLNVAYAGYDSTPPPNPADEGTSVYTRVDGRIQEMRQVKAVKPAPTEAGHGADAGAQK